MNLQFSVANSMQATQNSFVLQVLKGSCVFKNFIARASSANMLETPFHIVSSGQVNTWSFGP